MWKSGRPLCASLRNRNQHRISKRHSYADETTGTESVPWSNPGLYPYRKNPFSVATVWGTTSLKLVQATPFSPLPSLDPFFFDWGPHFSGWKIDEGVKKVVGEKRWSKRLGVEKVGGEGVKKVGGGVEEVGGGVEKVGGGVKKIGGGSKK